MELELIKKRELEIMKEFHRVCDEANLKYVLAFGSMIGCIRHDGFIPWDDDIDVTMPYDDYIKFIEVANEYLKTDYFLQTPDTDYGYYYPFIKLRLKNSCVLSSYPPSGKFKEHGIYIDIFPTLNVPKSKFLLKKIKFSNLIWSQISRMDSKIIIKASKRSLVGKAIMYILYILNKIFPKGYPNKILFKNALAVKDEESDELYIGDFYSEFNSINDYRLPKDVFDNRFLHKFEDAEFYMPCEYHSIMEKMYGDYMKLPAEDKRKTHGFVFVSDKMSYSDYVLQMGKKDYCK